MVRSSKAAREDWLAQGVVQAAPVPLQLRVGRWGEEAERAVGGVLGGDLGEGEIEEPGRTFAREDAGAEEDLGEREAQGYSRVG